MKKTYSVYVDDSKVTRARDLGFEISNLLDRTLDMVLSEEYEDMIIMNKLRIFDERIESTELSIIENQFRIQILEKDLGMLKLEREALVKDYEYTKRIIHVNRLTQAVNQILILHDYNVDESMPFAQEIVDELKEINPEFNITEHAKRLKIIMTS